MYIVLEMKGAEDTEEEEINLSKYEETATEVRQPAHLIAALKELGFRSEFHPAGVNLVGYEGRERPERAQIVVRRDQIGAASNDIRICQEPDGTFAAVLSGYDRSIGFDEKWLAGFTNSIRRSRCLPTLGRKAIFCARARSRIRRQARRSGCSSWRGETCKRRRLPSGWSRTERAKSISRGFRDNSCAKSLKISGPGTGIKDDD
jgi:hypothetical protein